MKQLKIEPFLSESEQFASTYCRSLLPHQNRQDIPARRRTASVPEHTDRSSRRTLQGRTFFWLDRGTEEKKGRERL